MIRLLAEHPSLTLAAASSRELAGRPVAETVPAASPALVFENIAAQDLVQRHFDVVILALPNGASAPFVAAIEEGAPKTIIVDLSADHRFDDAWAYGLPEHFRDTIRASRRIANPGCYATAAQIALAPLADVIEGVPAVFGVSGYSGAGTTPGPRNDPERLADNLMPYKLVGHNHEKEAIRHLGIPVRFIPHVHPAFRGLLVTAHVPLADAMDGEQVRARFEAAYGGEPLVETRDEIPELRDGAGHPGLIIGGFETSADGRNAVVVVAEDNLLKGAAVQAVQNINLALGLPEFEGLT